MLYFFSENEGVSADVLAGYGIFPDKLVYNFEDLEQIIPFLTPNDLCIVLINGFTRVVPVRLSKLFSDVGLTLDGTSKFIRGVTDKVRYRDLVIGKSECRKILLLTDVPRKRLNVMQVVYTGNPFNSEYKLYDGKRFLPESKVNALFFDMQSELYTYFFGTENIEVVQEKYCQLKDTANALSNQYFQNNRVLDKEKLNIKHNSSKTEHNLQHIENKKEKKRLFRGKKEQQKETSISLAWAVAYLCMLHNMHNGVTVEMEVDCTPVLSIKDNTLDEKIAYVKNIILFDERNM